MLVVVGDIRELESLVNCFGLGACVYHILAGCYNNRWRELLAFVLADLCDFVAFSAVTETG